MEQPTEFQALEFQAMNADRRLALVALVSLTILFSIVALLLCRWSDSTATSPELRPRFVTNLAEADKEEWMLLPGVGPKTAQRWDEDLSKATTDPAAAKELSLSTKSKRVVAIDSLEDLHGVGPIRAERLAPFITNLTVHPDKPSAAKSKSSVRIKESQ